MASDADVTSKTSDGQEAAKDVLPPYTIRLLAWSFAVGVVPPIALIAAIGLLSLLLLEYVHVISGARGPGSTCSWGS